MTSLSRFLAISTKFIIWASPASPPFYQANPIATTKINFLGTYHMLGLARRHGAKIFHSSTSEVYGDPEVHPQEESYRGCVNPIGPRSCYDEGKRVAESPVLRLSPHAQDTDQGGAHF